MAIMCPCMIETDYIKMTDDWIIEESGYSAKELFDNIMSYGEFKKFASKSNCNSVAIFTNNFDTENEVRKYLKKIEKEINSDDELLYEMNYSFNKYNNVIINNAKYMFCGIINFEPKTPMKNFMISNGGLTKRNLRESAETIFDFCEDMNKMWKNYDVEFIANDGVEDSVTVLIGTNYPKMVAEYIYANHFRGVKYANVGVEKNKAMLIFYHFSEHSSNEIERLAFDAITDANIRYNLFEKSRKFARRSLKESYNSEVDLMYDYEKIFKKKGWEVNRNPLKDNTLSAMHISIFKNTEDGQVCFYIYCDWGVDGYGDYYSCQINDCSDAEYDYDVINYKGFEVSGRGFLLFERNQTKFCKYLEQTLNELANLKVEKV